MKSRPFFFGRLLLLAAALISFSGSAQAASQIWSGSTDASWTTAANWNSNAVPGINPADNADNTTDVATFNSALSVVSATTIGDAANPIIIDSNRMIGRLVFDTASVGAYYIGATAGSPTLMLGNNLTVIDVRSAVTTAQTINAAIGLHLPSSTNGAATVQNNATSSSATLTLAGGIVNAPNSTRGTVWTLGGSNTGENTVSGIINISNTGGISSSLVKTGIGTWVLAGANTIPGGVTINGGTLAAANNTALGSSGTANNNAININSAGILEVRNGTTLNNGLSLNLASGGTIRGIGTAGTDGRINVGTTAGTSVTLKVTNASDVLTIGNGTNDFTGGASDSVVHIDGAGSVAIATASNYAGGIAFDAASKLRLGSTLSLTGLTGNGTVENIAASNGTLTVNYGSASTTLAQTLQNNSGGGTLAFTKVGTGTLTLNKAHGYGGATTVTGGGLKLDFTGGSAPATNIIGSTSALTLNGATLEVVGASASNTQTFANTAANAGRDVVSVSGSATTTLGAVTFGSGSSLNFTGVSTSTGASTATGQTGATGNANTTGFQSAIGTITTTSGSANNVLRGTSGVANLAAATVGVYDYAAASGVSPFSIVGLSQITGVGADGGYTLTTSTLPNASGDSGLHGSEFFDLVGTSIGGGRNGNNNYVGGLRFNANGATTLTTVATGNTSWPNILITPNVGNNNITINSGGVGVQAGQRSSSQDGAVNIWQNNTSGFLNFNAPITNNSNTGRSSALVQAGAGTVNYGGVNTYTNQTYLNGGYSIITAYSGFGGGAAPTSLANLNLNGGTVVANAASVSTDFSPTVLRLVFVNTNGGGLQATTGNTLTIGGVVSGSGALVIGGGTVAGTGAGMANTTALVGNGTVILAGANTHSGNIDINAGTLVANLANNTVTPVTSALGNMQNAGRSINVNNGGTLRLDTGDTLGGATAVITPRIVISAGGTLTNNTAGGVFNSLGPITLNGGILTGNGGAVATNYEMYRFSGNVTVDGTSTSTISSTGTSAGYHLGANTTFNVADATSSSASDLNVSAVLINQTASATPANAAGGLTKSGPGTMTLIGTNTYTGTTSVSGGTLAMGPSGSLANTPVTVGGNGSSSTPTLAGGGTISGATILAAAGTGVAGTHSIGITGVGDDVGTQTFSSTLSYQTGSIFAWDMVQAATTDPGAAPAAGGVNAGTYDTVVMNGAANSLQGSGAIFQVVLGAGKSFADAFWDTDKTWNNIFSGTGAAGVNLTSLFSTFSGANVASSGEVALEGQFSFNGSTTLTWNSFSAVPEPTSALVGLLVGAGLLRRRRA